MVEHKKAYSKDNPNATFYVEDQLVVDLFPYKVKDRERFYFRDHPERLHPDSAAYNNYWENEFLPPCIEGKWVEDAGGTWVYMMPKLFYYVNYVRIVDDDRNKIHPDLCDLEWIFFTYFLCMDGFSGFEEDDKYTCNRLVERHENSMDLRFTESERENFKLNEIELIRIPKSCYSEETGELKKFIDPWDYLTRTYLIDEPRGKLGLPLYKNQRQNGFILGARGIRKSFTVFMGDFLHEFHFSGVRRMSNLRNVNKQMLFAMGSGSGDQLQRTINNIRGFYDSQPGKFKYDDADKEDFMGPYYKNYQGKFEVGKEFQHIIKGAGNTVELFGSTVQMSVIRPDRMRIVAGDRFRRIYIEEVGFIEYILEVYSANVDSVRLGNTITGSWIGLGCVCEGTKVLTNKGHLINVEDLNWRDGIIGFGKDECVRQDITYMQPPEQKFCLEITTNTGRQLRCSTDHPIFKRNIKKSRYPNSDKRYVKSYGEFWEADSLNIGDQICVVDKVDVWGGDEIFCPRLIGLLIGDGSYGEKQNVRLHSKDDEVWNFVESKFEVVYRDISESGLRKGRIKGIIPEIECLGIRGQTKLNKRLPEKIFTAKKEDVCELIGGYFDSDGCVSFNESTGYGTIKVTSICKELISDVSLLLNKMGIHGRIRVSEPRITELVSGKNKEYSLYIKDKRSVIEFYNNIKLLVNYKQENLKKFYKACLKRRNAYFKDTPFRFEKIISKKYIGYKNIYNLTAAGTNTYLANNILTHNTGGDMESIRGPKQIFEKPTAFRVCNTPYYWKNPGKRIGLFIPAQYQKRDLDDGNGFIYLDLATKEILKDRENWYSKLDSVSAASRVMFNPIVPDEMLIPNELSILPKKEAQLRISEVESLDLFQRFANVGTLEYDSAYPHGVRFDKDLNNKVHPILEYNIDMGKTDLSGGFIMYEPPPSGKIPKYMYWVIYDPAAQSGDGTSLHSILVYKHFLTKDNKNFKDTIVAEWLGRLPTLELNYEMVIKIAKFFNARIFPETNIAGFIEWCIRNNHAQLLQRDSYELQKEISPGSKRSHYRAGFRMMAREKWWALQRYATWLMEPKVFDPETGIPIRRNVDFIYSPRILNEIVFYNETDNFDHTSSMLGLMILLGQLDKMVPPQDEDLEEDDWVEPIIYKPKNITRRRSLLEQF